MVSNHPLKFFLILTLAASACGSPAASASPTPASAQEATLAPTVSTASLTVEQIKNAQYQLGGRDDRAVVQLTDGKYQQGSDASTLDFAYIALTDFVSVGDITNDGVDEVAAIFFENYGGTGNFGFLAIYANVNGLPVFLTSTLIDDRPMINNMIVENGEIFMDAIVHGFEDGGCCPTLSTTRRYALVNNKLRIVNYTTASPSGAKRIVEITSPMDGTEVSGSGQVSGNVSIAPFENNLSYFIYDDAGNQLAAGPVPVTASDFGAPGTFNGTFMLEGIPPDTVIYLEIQDISAADGSWLAMDAVKLLVK